MTTQFLNRRELVSQIQRYEPVHDIGAAVVCHNLDEVTNQSDEQLARDCMRHTVAEGACHEPSSMTQPSFLEKTNERQLKAASGIEMAKDQIWPKIKDGWMEQKR